MAKKNVTLKDEASNELNPETVITQVKDSSNAALFTEASGTISTTSGHTINGASITDSSITSDKLAKDSGGSVIFNDNFKVDGFVEITSAGDLYMNSTQIFDVGGINFSSNENGINLNGNSLVFSSDDDVSIEYDSSGNELVFNINGGLLKMNSDGHLIVSSNLEIEDDRFNYLGHEMLLFERSGSSPNYVYNINFQGNNITNVYSIKGNNDWRIDSDGCVINDTGTEIYFRSDYFSNNIHQYCDFSTEGGSGWYLRDYRGGTEYLEIVGRSEDFTQQVQYTFKEDSIYRATKSNPNVAWSTPVDLIPHLFLATVEWEFLDANEDTLVYASFQVLGNNRNSLQSLDTFNGLVNYLTTNGFTGNGKGYTISGDKYVSMYVENGNLKLFKSDWGTDIASSTSNFDDITIIQIF